MGSQFYAWLKAACALVKKDLIDEFRTRYAITSMALFALTALTIVSFSAGVIMLDPVLHSAFLWIIIFFSAMSALGRSFIKEEESGTAMALKLSAAPEVIYTGKLLFNLLLLLGLNLILYPLYLIFMNPPAGINHLLLFVIIMAGSFCLAGTTTILAAIVAGAGAKNTLLPVLAFPVLLPVLLTAIRGGSVAFAGGAYSEAAAELTFLLSFFVVIVTVSLLLFNYIWED
jgi:heme exporter protein B